jgi:hypothetical protein
MLMFSLHNIKTLVTVTSCRWLVFYFRIIFVNLQ